MRDAHFPVIENIGEMIGWESIALDDDKIVEGVGGYCSIYLVIEGVDLQLLDIGFYPNHIFFSISDLCLYLLKTELAALAIICFLLLCFGGWLFAETRICVAIF